MIKKLNIKDLRIVFVFRHRFEKDQNKFDPIFKAWEISLWFRRFKIVGRKRFSQPNEWKDNLINSYQLGIKFLIFKTWIEWDRGGMHLEIEV